MLKNINVVLVQTSHPGNIGGAARALKNMGLEKLRLVMPKNFPCADATARAAGADDVLASATTTNTLAQALQNCSLVIGTSARLRELSLPILDPRSAAIKITETAKTQQVAIVFGRENNGLTNEELLQCHYQLHIPTNPEFSSLNLAAAVQLIAYEIRMASTHAIITAQDNNEMPTAEDIQMLYKHLQEIPRAINFLDPKHPCKTLKTLI